MRVVVLRTVTHTSQMVVEADSVGEAEDIAALFNETEWSTPVRKQDIRAIGTTGV